MIVSLSAAKGKKGSSKLAGRIAVFVWFLLFNAQLRSPFWAAEVEPDPQINGITVGVGTRTPAPTTIQSATALGAELNQLRTSILQQNKALEEQNKAIEELKAKLSQQESIIQALQKRGAEETKEKSGSAEGPSVYSEPASLIPPEPSIAMTSSQQKNVVSPENEKKSEEKPVANALSINGFKFSGDFRLRLDAQDRSGNEIATPVQSVRARYRVRVNVDKEIDRMFNFHLQLSTGPYNVGTTNDQDFAGMVAKHPFSIAEAYVDFHPNSKVAIRGGRMEEVYADSMRFLWDDDVRFNGFQQIIKLPINADNSVELRAGEYWLGDPNLLILQSTSPYVAAGFPVGQRVRDANLFHSGVVLNLTKGGPWRHQFGVDMQVYRNANQIQLASTANGFPVLVNPSLGLALSGPLSAAGNGATTRDGAALTAHHFDIGRAYYRIEHKGLKVGEREMPLWFDFQVSRNFGTGFLRDAVMGSFNFGAIKKTGDLRFLYQYTIKDANSIVSQFTDDNLGTGAGVNIAVHALRFDVGITRFLQWQNLLFIQNARRGDNPSQLLFVPLQRGANTTFHYLGQLAFTF